MLSGTGARAKKKSLRLNCETSQKEPVLKEVKMLEEERVSSEPQHMLTYRGIMLDEKY